jgi:hypothetical protein
VGLDPWRRTLLEFCRNVVRFGLWLALASNAAMLAVFSIVFTYEFLAHSWTWCRRVLFTGTW